MSSSPYLVPRITRPFDAHITLPGSKSIALRQLAIAALTDGCTVLHGVPPCDDTDAMLDCLGALGVQVHAQPDQSLQVQGPMQLDGEVHLNPRMSGASTRLLIGLAALRRGPTHIDGHGSLRVRTNAPLYEVLRRHGCRVDDHQGGLPVTLQGPITNASHLQIDGSLSSQYITALLVIAPLLAEPDKPVHIELSSQVVSRPYIDITLTEMAKRGADAAWRGGETLVVQAGAYQPGEYRVEGDATAATYFTALATLHSGRVTLDNLGHGTHQGDYGFCRIMESLGAQVTSSDDSTTVQGPGNLKPLPSQDMTTMPDAALTLIALSPLLPDGAHITGLSSLHHKECDRLKSPAAEFVPMGISAQTTHDSIRVQPLDGSMHSHVLTTYHDHRMAMAFSILGSVSGNLSIDDKAVVDKTFPAYWQAYEQHLAG